MSLPTSVGACSRFDTLPRNMRESRRVAHIFHQDWPAACINPHLRHTAFINIHSIIERNIFLPKKVPIKLLSEGVALWICHCMDSNTYLSTKQLLCWNVCVPSSACKFFTVKMLTLILHWYIHTTFCTGTVYRNRATFQRQLKIPKYAAIWKAFVIRIFISRTLEVNGFW